MGSTKHRLCITVESVHSKNPSIHRPAQFKSCHSRITCDLENVLMVAGRKDGERDSWESGMDTYTLLYLRRITNEDLLYSTWNSA